MLRVMMLVIVGCVYGTPVAQAQGGVRGVVGEAADPATLEISKWSGGIMIPDPVAISIDPQGRAYLTQTQRRKANDLDIRSNRDWVPNDVGFLTVAQKQAFYHERLAPELSAQNTGRVLDMNKDGLHDWRDLTVLSEKIHLLEDTDGDGEADRFTVYAEDFKTEVTGVAAGVLYHEGDVYSTIAPDVWKLRDTDGDGVADQREKFSSGYGVHIGYGGHDMHGLTVGPDGKIYWSIGDKGVSVFTPDGVHHLYSNQGAVMRANVDGSDFEVFAHGLRNVQELAFDDYGNLFGVDNDSDQKGEMERFVYIVRGMDAGWRTHYQYRGEGYNPWTAEKLWVPHHAGQAAYIVPPIRNYIDGPAGFAYNPGTAISPDYKGYFFLTGAPKGNQYAFQVAENGASFEMVNDHAIGKGVPMVGVAFGPDGALYSVDWGGGYPLNQSGAVWKIDNPKYADSPMRLEVRGILGGGFNGKSVPQLVKWLGHEDQRVRLGAQFELVKGGHRGALVRLLENEHQLSRVHAVWGLGQLARAGDGRAVGALVELLEDKDLEIQAQVIKALGDLKAGMFESGLLIGKLKSKSARVRFFAGVGLGYHPTTEALGATVKMIEENAGQDLYLRYAGIAALSGCGDLKGLVAHPDEQVRLAATVGMRRQGDANLTLFLNDASPLVATEAARGIHDDFSIEEALAELAASLNGSDRGEAFTRRAINTNLRLGTAANATALAKYAANGANDMAMRLEAMGALADWVEPPVLDRVTGRNRHSTVVMATNIDDALGEYLTQLAGDSESRIQARALGLAKDFGFGIGASTLRVIVLDEDADDDLRVEALGAMGSGRLRDEVVRVALGAGAAKVRSRALELYAAHDAAGAVVEIEKVLGARSDTVERQKAIELLGLYPTEKGDGVVLGLLRGTHDAGGDVALRLEILEAAKMRQVDDARIATALANRTSQLASAGDELATFEGVMEGGNARRGESVFMNHIAAQCIRCHKVPGVKGSDIGPELKDISKKEPRYILESLIKPSAVIAEGYGMVAVAMADGAAGAGNVVEENEKTLVLRDVNGKRVKFAKQDIIARTEAVTVMPPIGLILNPFEIRDLMAYLKGI